MAHWNALSGRKRMDPHGKCGKCRPEVRHVIVYGLSRSRTWRPVQDLGNAWGVSPGGARYGHAPRSVIRVRWDVTVGGVTVCDASGRGWRRRRSLLVSTTHVSVPLVAHVEKNGKLVRHGGGTQLEITRYLFIQKSTTEFKK